MRKYILILRLTPHISGIQGAGIDQGLGMPDVHGVQGQPGQGETRHGGPLCFFLYYFIHHLIKSCNQNYYLSVACLISINIHRFVWASALITL